MRRTLILVGTALTAAAMTLPATAQSRPAGGGKPSRGPARAGGAAGRGAGQAASSVARNLAWMAGTWAGKATVSQSPRPIPLEIVVTPELGGKFFLSKTKVLGPAAALLDDVAMIGAGEEEGSLVAWRFSPKGAMTQDTVTVLKDEGKVIFEGESDEGRIRRTLARAEGGVALTIEKIDSASGESEVILDVSLRKLPPGLAAKFEKAGGGPRRAGGRGGRGGG